MSYFLNSTNDDAPSENNIIQWCTIMHEAMDGQNTDLMKLQSKCHVF